MTTNNLTEQWKKGELEQGWYYVKNEFGNIFISEYSKDYDFIGERVISGFFTEVSEIIEIICEVPSYEQWQQMKAFCEEFNALEVSEENQKLKSKVDEYHDYWDLEKAYSKDLKEENEKLEELLKKCNKTFFEIRLSLASGKINSVFDLSYQRENDIDEVLK